MRTRVPLARRFIAAFLLGLLTGCQSWHPTTLSPRALIPEERPSSVRITLTNGAIITVMDPAMRNDSIVSTEFGVAAWASRDVRSLEVQRFSPGKTIGLFLVTVAFAASWASVVPGNSGSVTREPPLPKDTRVPMAPHVRQ